MPSALKSVHVGWPAGAVRERGPAACAAGGAGRGGAGRARRAAAADKVAVPVPGAPVPGHAAGAPLLLSRCLRPKRWCMTARDPRG